VIEMVMRSLRGVAGRRPFAATVRLALLLGFLAASLTGWGVAAWTETRTRNALREEERAQLALYGANLRTELEKHRAVPFVLARDVEVADLLMIPAPRTVERLSRKLEEIARALPASALYVMDESGTTIAASNWDQPDSFIGQNFAFRPYFRDAVEHGEGHNFALGTTSLKPGYYTAHRVVAENRTLGVVVLKVGFEALEQGWRATPDAVAVTDRDGMVFITDVDGWRYRSLPGAKPADPEAVNPLPWRLLENGEVAVEEDGARRPYLLQSAAVPEGDWTLHILTSLETVERRATTAGLLAAVVAGLLALSGVLLAQRRQALAERLVFQEQARHELERRVAQATADLRATENELVQAAKLAALGQMSAGIAHEINQPLAALRTFADNAAVLLERGHSDRVRDNLAEIAALTDRMATITRHLKGFARRASGTLGAVAVNGAVREALALLEARLHRDGVSVALELPPEPVWVLGEDVRLQQVLVNLFSNAVDAMRGRPVRVLGVHLAADGAEAVLTVRDTGHGLRPDALAHLFSPFFTTKEADEGLGLGLSISHGIVTDFGGSITAGNAPDGGAVFTVRLKRTEPAP